MTFDDLPIGTRVRVVSPWVDFYPFFGETGEVVRNDEGYLGVIVLFDEPRHFEDGFEQRMFNFDPEDLELIAPEVSLKSRIVSCQKEARE